MFQAETRAEFAERSVQKLQKEVDRLEGRCLNYFCCLHTLQAFLLLRKSYLLFFASKVLFAQLLDVCSLTFFSSGIFAFSAYELTACCFIHSHLRFLGIAAARGRMWISAQRGENNCWCKAVAAATFFARDVKNKKAPLKAPICESM